MKCAVHTPRTKAEQHRIWREAVTGAACPSRVEEKLACFGGCAHMAGHPCDAKSHSDGLGWAKAAENGRQLRSTILYEHVRLIQRCCCASSRSARSNGTQAARSGSLPTNSSTDVFFFYRETIANRSVSTCIHAQGLLKCFTSCCSGFSAFLRTTRPCGRAAPQLLPRKFPSSVLPLRLRASSLLLGGVWCRNVLVCDVALASSCFVVRLATNDLFSTVDASKCIEEV